MKKIMIITNHSYMLWRFRRELIQALLEKHEVVISTPFVGHEKDLSGLGCRMIETQVDRRGINPVTDFKLYRAYMRLLKAEKPDLVITYSIKPNIYAGFACRQKKIPYCVNVQGLGTAFQKPGLSQVVTMMYRTALKKAKTVFFENEENAELFRERGITPAVQQTVLHGAGINLEIYSYEAYPAREGTKEEPFRFLYLGRIMKEKGMDELFWAMEKLYETSGRCVVFDLVGFFEDEYKEQVENLVEKGIAVFYGFQPEPEPYYRNADCVVLPSYHEGLSNVLLESAATGRPLITSDIPGCRETVDDEKSGYLCEVKNREMLYEKMEKMFKLTVNERKQMGALGREKMEREFAKEEVVKQTLKALEV